MGKSTYYATSAVQLLVQAHRTLETHVTSSATGHCLGWGSPGPCSRRESAVVIFSRSLRLTGRQPGASQPTPVDTRRVGSDRLALASW